MHFKAKKIEVYNGVFTEVHEGSSGRQILSQSPYVVHGAIHDSGERYPPSECHPGTREDILDIALGWVDKPLDESESQMFWLSGPAGVGKTAIAQSLCQRLKELSRLGGDFFLSRSVAGHSNLHTLFPTLAYQLSQAFPEFGLELDHVIKADESILTKNMELQLERLIIGPLKRVNDKLDIPLTLIIDGLDEAGGEGDQSLFLRLLGSILSHRFPLKIFLISRPEPWIKTAFSNKPLLGSSQSHFLHHTSQTDNDICIVLKSEFAEIRRTHDLMKSWADSWPPIGVIDEIIDRASGQFIYVATILRYIKDSNGHPVDRLQWIMKAPSVGHRKFTDSPFIALDNLYKHVLSTSPDIDRTLTILGIAIIYRLNEFARTFPVEDCQQYPRTGFSIERIERILNFRADDSFLATRTIHSLVNVSSWNGKRTLEFYHKSFEDFLLHRNRSGEYFIDVNQVYSKLMYRIIRLIRELEQSNTIANQREIQLDVMTIEGNWEVWWLLSAASDENQLLAKVKAIDHATRETLFFKLYRIITQRSASEPRLQRRFYLVDLTAGSIAYNMHWKSRLEKFLTARAVLSKHLKALHSKFEGLVDIPDEYPAAFSTPDCLIPFDVAQSTPTAPQYSKFSVLYITLAIPREQNEHAAKT